MRPSKRKQSFRRESPLTDNPDAVVLDLLKKFDKHMGAERRIVFFLSFSSKKKIRQAGSELESLGLFAAKIRWGRQWLCLASKTMIPRFHSLAGMRRVLEDIADRLDGEYDGWETVILDGNEMLKTG